MMKQWKLIIILIIMVVVGYYAVPLFALTDREAEELVKYTDEILYPKECKVTVDMKNFEGEGRETENRMECWFKGDKFLGIFQSPPIQKGQKFLMNGDNMWMYLPKSKMVMRISAKERSMGGEANNTDIMRVDLVRDYTIKYLADENIGNTSCYKLELTGKNRKVAYAKIVYWISKNEKIPVKREYYSISGKIMNNWYFEDVKILDNVKRPSKYIIENALNKTYRTEIIMIDMDGKARFRDSVFTPNYIKNM